MRSDEGQYIAWLDAAPAEEAPRLLGGKLGSLAAMVSSGFAVPPGFGVTTAAYRAVAERNGVLDELAPERDALDPDDLAAVAALSARVAKRMEQAPLPPGLGEAIAGAYVRLAELTGDPRVPVAVRSSGVSEDLAGASFAGQYDTFLWVAGADEVVRHVRRCWAGLGNSAVLTYRPDGDTGADPLRDGMAVGVQQMVPARAAGVMFTLDPVSGDRSKIVMEAAWGLGEGVVKGAVAPQRVRVDKVTLEILGREVAEQPEEYRFDPDRGEVRLAAVPEDRRTAACLADEQVVELARLGKRIERHHGAPQDIEWALDDRGAIHLLQVRPETVWSRRPAPTIASEGGSGLELVLSRFMAGGPKQ
jgi:phosphoenolpyruvate synthase/pyruvate phosphate dikinase